MNITEKINIIDKVEAIRDEEKRVRKDTALAMLKLEKEAK